MDNRVDVPEWAKDAVWYQIFPERFRNGNPAGNPRVEDINEGPIPGWKISKWGSDWYDMDSWEKENFDSVFQSVFKRRYGGDLQGIIEKLDYLKDLGISAIYLNPVFRSPSLHKYDGSSFHHVEETLGPDPAADRKMLEDACETHDPETWIWTEADRLLLKLINEVHNRGMKIILDGVFNHSGRPFFAFQDILKKGRDSAYSQWYKIDRWDNSLEDGFDYQGWWGLKYLPEFRQAGDNFDPGYKEYLFNITRRWMAPDGEVDRGIDGWRLDVAFLIPHDFWKEWRRVVKGINPQAYLTAEVIEILPEFLKGDEFDAFMNYQFLIACSRFFIDRNHRITASEFISQLEDVWNAYPEDISFVMQNLYSSHDTPRIRSVIVNPDNNYGDWHNFHHISKLEHNNNFRIHRGDEEHRDIHKLMALFQMTYRGAPMIYYGDEVGMAGANDPDCRKPMVWDDLEYEDEAVHPLKPDLQTPGKNRVEKDLLEHYKKLIYIRNNYKSLRRGGFRTLLIDDDKECFVFAREYEGEKVLVAINNSPAEQIITLDTKDKGFFHRDLIDGKTFEGSLIELAIRPKEGAILLREPRFPSSGA